MEHTTNDTIEWVDMKKYILERNAMEKIIINWELAKEKAKKQVVFVDEKTKELNSFTKQYDKKHDLLSIEYITEQYFKEVRKIMYLYTQDLPKIIEQIESENSFSEEIVERLKIVRDEAQKCKKEFRKAKSNYDRAKELYTILYKTVYGRVL